MSLLSACQFLKGSLARSSFLIPSLSQTDSIRWSTSFFTRHTADQIWKGVTSVSSAGAKRGRGRGSGKKRIRDLNRGQTIGIGKINMLWPGLNSNIIRGREVIDRKQLPPNPDYWDNIVKIRDRMNERRGRSKMHPLERGWSGTKMPGRSIGADLEGFDTKVLLAKPTSEMTGRYGRVRKVRTMVVTGNGQGLAGYAMTEAKDQRAALRRAKKIAQLNLLYVPIFEGHTVIHDFYSKFGSTELFIFKRPHGYGLEGHRVVKTICEMIGIKDLTAIVEGNCKNTLNMTRAFFLGLLSQKTFQQMADEKKLHVVEFRAERNDFPVVVASPADGNVRKLSEIASDENLDFKMYLFDGHIVDTKQASPPFYLDTWGYDIYKRKIDYVKNRNKVRIQLIAKYGGLESFLTIREKERLAKLREEHFRKSAEEASEEVAANETTASDEAAQPASL